MESIVKAIASAVIAYSVHYSTVKIYTTVCVPDGLWGYVQGLVSMGSPMCQAGVQIIQSTQVSYSSMLMFGLTRFALDVVMPSSSTSQADIKASSADTLPVSSASAPVGQGVKDGSK